MAGQRAVRAGERVLDVGHIDDGRIVTRREVKLAPAVIPVVCVVAASDERGSSRSRSAHPLSAVPPTPRRGRRGFDRADGGDARILGDAHVDDTPPATLKVTVTVLAPAAAARMLAA